MYSQIYTNTDEQTASQTDRKTDRENQITCIPHECRNYKKNYSRCKL